MQVSSVSLPAARHGVAGVESEVHDDLLDLSGIGADGAQVVGGRGEHFDVFANQPPQQRIETQHDVVEIDHPRREHLLPAERQQLAGNAGGALGRRFYLLRAFGETTSGRDTIGKYLRISQNYREQIIEIVRNPASQATDRFHFLRLAKTVFKRHTLGHVLHQGSHAKNASRFVNQGSVVPLAGNQAAVFGDVVVMGKSVPGRDLGAEFGMQQIKPRPGQPVREIAPAQ